MTIEHGRPERKDLAIFASELDLARSRFFHQCEYLGLKFASKDGGPNLATGEDLHLTREKWSVQYVPEVDGRLVELRRSARPSRTSRPRSSCRTGSRPRDSRRRPSRTSGRRW